MKINEAGTELSIGCKRRMILCQHSSLQKFEWNPKITPHILELKQRYVITDLKVTSHFKSGFSWRLYDYLKAHYGYWHKESSKEGLMKLFGVENVKSYQKGTAHFKRRVLDVAIKEINIQS